MQVEHKTEKGTILFVQAPNGHIPTQLYYHHNGFILYNTDNEFNLTIDIVKCDWQLIGLTSEVTEEWLTDIGFGHIDYIEDGLGPTDSFVYKLDSFESLIKFKNIQLPSIVLFKEN